MFGKWMGTLASNKCYTNKMYGKEEKLINMDEQIKRG